MNDVYALRKAENYRILMMKSRATKIVILVVQDMVHESKMKPSLCLMWLAMRDIGRPKLENNLGPKVGPLSESIVLIPHMLKL